MQVFSKRTGRLGLVVSAALGTLLSACVARIDGDLGNSINPSANNPSGNPPSGNPPAGNPSGNPSGGAPPVGVPPITSLPEASPCKTSNPGPRALRRLSAAEYNATLKDLFGDPNVPLTAVFNDPTVLGFSVDTRALVVQGLGAQQLMDQAESIAQWAATTQLNKLSSCTAMDASCRQSFIRSFGKRAHRAPLSDADVAVYEKIFSGEATFAAGAEAVVSAMLQSPYFLYRRELGTANGNEFKLSAYESASALSYLLTGSMPDNELFQAAESGALAQPAELQRHAERLLQSPRGHQSVATFMNGWLGLSKLETIAKDDTVFKLTDSLRKSMIEETRQFIDDAVFKQNASFLKLLTSKASFMNRELATHYGLPNAGSLGDQLMPVTIEPGQRDSGLLAQGGLLTALATAKESSPVQRGKMVRTRLLCQELPPPPANVDTNLKPSGSGKTTRQHFAEHSDNPLCASCHKMMDPIGFGFEHYDAFGRRREQDNGQPVDASGFVATSNGDIPFTGIPGLTEYLTTEAGDAVNSCLVRYWSYFAFGSAGWSEDQCTYDAIAEQAEADGFALQSVVKAIVKTSRFSRRVADP